MEFATEDMETYAHEARLPGEHLVLFLLATYGDGEPTDNALEFYNWVTAAAKGADGGGAGDDQLLKVRRMEHAALRGFWLACSSPLGFCNSQQRSKHPRKHAVSPVVSFLRAG